MKLLAGQQRGKHEGNKQAGLTHQQGHTMLVDRYETEDVFARVPRMAQRIDPVLKHLDTLLEDDELYQQIRADFGQRYRFTLVHGRHSTPVEVLLRMLILKHLYQWSY